MTTTTPELPQTLIRNACVNDGTVDSGHRSRNADDLAAVLEGPGHRRRAICRARLAAYRKLGVNSRHALDTAPATTP